MSLEALLWEIKQANFRAAQKGTVKARREAEKAYRALSSLGMDKAHYLYPPERS